MALENTSLALPAEALHYVQLLSEGSLVPRLKYEIRHPYEICRVAAPGRHGLDLAGMTVICLKEMYPSYEDVQPV